MTERPAGAPGESNGNDIATLIQQSEPLPLPELCARIHDKVQTFLNAEPPTTRIAAVQRQSRISLEVIGEALRRYSREELSISYNGGKDCLVLLILYLSALHTHYSQSSNSQSATTTNNHRLNSPPTQLPETLNSVYIQTKHPFQAVEDFVATSIERYHLSLARYANNMKDAFTEYLDEHRSIQAIFVGTRRTDPHGAKLKHFDPTDRGWPAFMRIHPVIDWHYAEIWTFIRELGIPYCSLYDLGYTSLGGTRDTHPNPALKFPIADGSEPSGFRPAYELLQDDEERLGRALADVDDARSPVE